MTSYGAWGPSGGALQGVWSTPIPTKPPELLPQVIDALAEVHLHHDKVDQVSQNRSSKPTEDQVPQRDLELQCVSRSVNEDRLQTLHRYMVHVSGKLQDNT